MDVAWHSLGPWYVRDGRVCTHGYRTDQGLSSERDMLRPALLRRCMEDVTDQLTSTLQESNGRQRLDAIPIRAEAGR